MGSIPASRTNKINGLRQRWRSPLVGLASNRRAGCRSLLAESVGRGDVYRPAWDVLTMARVSGSSIAMSERHYGHLRAAHATAALATLALWCRASSPAGSTHNQVASPLPHGCPTSLRPENREQSWGAFGREGALGRIAGPRAALQRQEPVASTRFLAAQFHESWSRSAAVGVGRQLLRVVGHLPACVTERGTGTA